MPEHWTIRRLKYVASINDEALSEKTSPDYELVYVDIGGVDPFAGITATENLIFENAPSRARRIVRSGDTIVSTVRTYLRAIAPIDNAQENLVVSTGFAVIRPRRIRPEFLSYALRETGFVQTIVARSTGVSYPAINATEIGTILIALPQQQDQTAIANFLDRKTAEIDALVSQKRSLIEKLQEKRSALISRTVTRGLHETVTLRNSGFEWLAEICAHWHLIPIKRLSRDTAKTFTDGDWIEAPFLTEAGIRLIQTGNIGIGGYKEQGFRFISEETFNELRCTEVCPNDVLICRLDGPVGRACLAPDLNTRMITSVDNTILKVREGVDPRFIVYFFSSAQWLSWIEDSCRVGGGFRFRISRTMLGNLQIPLPPYSEQIAIADYLDRETAKIDALIAKVEQAIERLQEYRTALITAAVTGKIDVRQHEKVAGVHA